MDAVAALLIVVFHFFFGWCGEAAPGRAPPAAPSEASSIR
jgi:peptidoglycan/LPS O-acetylase OafA/YrhL